MKTYLKLGAILTGIFLIIVVISCFVSGNEGYLVSSVEYPDEIQPSPVVDYGGSTGNGGADSHTYTNTATPEPEDQEDGYSEDNEDLESA